jgi:pilus assembly protein FimV
LFVALGSGAYASGLINGSQIKNHSIATKKLTKKAIAQLHGARGARGPAGATGATGSPGAAGAPGAAGSALAYAHVFSSGSVDASNAKNIASANVSEVSAGIYCISGLSFTPHNVVVTVDWNNGGGTPTITATLGIGGSSGCPAGTQVTVGTGDGSTLAARAFYVALN